VILDWKGQATVIEEGLECLVDIPDHRLEERSIHGANGSGYGRARDILPH
jgi:hypothetical protein